MKRSRVWLAVVVGGLVALLSIGAALLLEHSVDDQNQAQLQSEATQVTTLAESILTSSGPQLQTLGAVAQATNASPATFATEVNALFGKSPPPVALVRGGVVLLASGPGLAAGQPLAPALAAAVAGSHTGLFSPGVITVGRQHVVVLAVGTGQPGGAVLEEGVVQPAHPLPQLTEQYGFPDLNAAIYADPVARPDQLIITTAYPVPFSGPKVKTYVPVGSTKWLVVTSAKSPLAGSWPNAFPWILLGAGLTLALVLGILVSVLGRRERYAQELVAERTAELVSAQEEMVQKERLSAVGEMATMIGHELRNPLGAAINGLYLIRHHLGDEESPQLVKNLDLVERETQRAAALADDLTSYMRDRRPALERVELGTAADQVLEATAAPAGIEVTVESRTVAVDADADQLTQMLSNCVTNAYQAMPDGGSVCIRAVEANGAVEILVEDTGPGVDPKAVGRAFDPFFTTKAQGTGLGLAIVQRLAEAHGGEVVLSNRDGGGARVVIRLPRAGANLGSSAPR